VITKRKRKKTNRSEPGLPNPNFKNQEFLTKKIRKLFGCLISKKNGIFVHLSG
jgi:hypothetical protein